MQVCSTSAQQVAGDDDGAPGRGVALQHVAHLADLGRVEAVGRLVEHQQLGQAEHGLGDAEALPHAVAVGTDLAVDVLAQAGDLERDVEVRLVERATDRAPVEQQVVDAGEVRREARSLDERAHPRQHRRAGQ